MTEDPQNLLEPKLNRPPAEVGREVYRLLEKYGALRVESGDSYHDVKIYPADED